MQQIPKGSSRQYLGLLVGRFVVAISQRDQNGSMIAVEAEAVDNVFLNSDRLVRDEDIIESLSNPKSLASIGLVGKPSKYVVVGGIAQRVFLHQGVESVSLLDVMSRFTFEPWSLFRDVLVREGHVEITYDDGPKTLSS